jgi:serine/threonine protein kinase
MAVQGIGANIKTVRLISEGAYAFVYEARDICTNEKFAIKAISSQQKKETTSKEI